MSATPEVLEHVYLGELCMYCGAGEHDGERLNLACIARKVVTVHTIEQQAKTSDTAATATANEPARVVRHVYDDERCRFCGVNVYDDDRHDIPCISREPMVYTSETPTSPADVDTAEESR